MTVLKLDLAHSALHPWRAQDTAAMTLPVRMKEKCGMTDALQIKERMKKRICGRERTSSSKS